MELLPLSRMESFKKIKNKPDEIKLNMSNVFTKS